MGRWGEAFSPKLSSSQGRSQDFEVEEAGTVCAKRASKNFSLAMLTLLILGTWEVMCGSKADLHNLTKLQFFHLNHDTPSMRFMLIR